jgi:hypothetical protein
VSTAAAVSVVVTSQGAPALLRRCLAALTDQPSVRETIVVEGLADDPAAWVSREFPGVRVLHRRGLTVPGLRWAGACEAQGPLVAAIEASMQPALNWSAVLADGHLAWPDAPVIGGDVALEPHATALAAGFYLCEYVAFAAPASAREVTALSSANLSYKREALLAERDVLDGGQWEGVLHERWRRAGRSVRIVPATVVFRNVLTGRAALSMRFRFARAYAAERFPPAARARRAAYAAGCVVLPALMTWRVVRQALAGGHGANLRRSFGWVVSFNVSWTLGECAGYLLGARTPGHQRRRASPVAR